MPLPKHLVGVLLVGLCAGVTVGGCAGGGAGGGARTVESLDERSGVSVDALRRPIEFVQSDSLELGKRANFAYLGPLELDRMGSFGYVLWVHLAPGTGKTIADVRADGALSLVLDDGVLALRAVAAPTLGREPYRPVVSWGQTAYFAMDAAQLQRLSSSRSIVLRCRATDGAQVEFRAGADAHAILAAYAEARGLNVD
jgi:hypothetical protein